MSKNRKKINKGISFSLIVFIITMFFFYLPIIVLIILSFNASKTMTWGGFSLRWYEQLFFKSQDLWKAFGNSILLAFMSSAFATVIGTLGAIGIYWYNFKFKKYIEVTSYLPLILPDIIMVVFLLIMFNIFREFLGFQLGLITIFIAHTTFNIPYVLFIVMSRLEEFDYSIIEAAYDLGAGEIDTLLKVIVPISLPGIIAGFLISVTLSIDDFVITFFVSGPGSSTLPLHIYSMIRYGASYVINAISVILIITSILFAFSTRNFYKYMLSN